MAPGLGSRSHRWKPWRLTRWTWPLPCWESSPNGLMNIPWENGTEMHRCWKSKMGLSENRVYSQWNSHLIGIMISKTIGFRGTLFSDTPKWNWPSKKTGDHTRRTHVKRYWTQVDLTTKSRSLGSSSPGELLTSQPWRWSMLKHGHHYC